MMEVRCCCTPENLIGYLPEGTPLPMRATVDEHGNAGVAYSSEGLSDFEITGLPGFVRPPLHAGKKTWKKTWRGK